MGTEINQVDGRDLRRSTKLSAALRINPHGIKISTQQAKFYRFQSMPQYVATYGTRFVLESQGSLNEIRRQLLVTRLSSCRLCG